MSNTPFTQRWHFRLLRKLNITPSRNLCVYFWQVLLAAPLKVLSFLCLIIFVLAGMAYIVHLVLSPIYVPLFFDLELIFEEGSGYRFFAHSFAIGVIIWIAVGFLFIFEGLKYMSKNKPQRPERSSSNGLIKSYIKAKKEKICPRLDF